MSKKKIDIPGKVKGGAELISAIIVIGGALIGAGQWMVHQINSSVNARVDALEQKIDDNREADELSTTRLELMMLMQHDPDNVIEIEKLAKSYFSNGGNSYMTSVFSKYCAERDLNCAEIVLK